MGQAVFTFLCFSGRPCCLWIRRQRFEYPPRKASHVVMPELAGTAVCSDLALAFC